MEAIAAIEKAPFAKPRRKTFGFRGQSPSKRPARTSPNIAKAEARQP
jgi:hypothetical protein